MTIVDPSDIEPPDPAWRISGFWRAIGITALAAIVFSALVNFLVDPYDIYHTGLIPRDEINFYETKLDLFKALDPPPQALIIGSSRTYAFDPKLVEEITGKRCFNFSLAGAKAETFYSVLRLAVDEYHAPIDTLILGIDPETFHPTLPIEPESRFISAYSRYYIYNESGTATVWERIALLFTLDQTAESISSLQRVFRKNAGIKWMEFRPDGYSIFTAREDEIANGTFDLQSALDTRVRKYPERSLGLSEFTGLSDTRKHYWEDFISICREKNIHIYAFIPVEHPRLYEELMSQGAGDIFSQVSDYLASTLDYDEWVFRDFTDITSFGGDPNQFYDEIHLRPPNADLELRTLLSSESLPAETASGTDNNIEPNGNE